MQTSSVCKSAGTSFVHINSIKRVTIYFLSLTTPSRNVLLCSVIIAFLIPFSAVVNASTVTLAWDQNVESDIAGYRVHYGTSTRNYDYSIDIGNYTSCTISDLQEGTTYYFAATAYNSQLNESDFSEEITYTIPITSPADPLIYISDITFDLFQKGPNCEIKAKVTVLDEIDSAVSEAVVWGQWFLNGKYLNEVSELSDRKGVAIFISDKVKAQSGYELSLLITNVEKNGYSYDSGLNISDEISAICP